MLKNILKTLAVVAVTAVLFTASAYAENEDEGLYDALPPEGSVFVRFIHAQAGTEGELDPYVNGRQRDGVKFTGVKPYGVVPPGNIKLALGDVVSKEFEAEPSKFYTVVFQNNELSIHEDPQIQDDLKAQMLVYNLTSRDNITLKTADGKVAVVGPLKAGEIADREINPIKVSFAVYAGDEVFAELSDWPLERKESYIIAVFEEDGQGFATYDRARLSEE